MTNELLINSHNIDLSNILDNKLHASLVGNLYCGANGECLALMQFVSNSHNVNPVFRKVYTKLIDCTISHLQSLSNAITKCGGEPCARDLNGKYPCVEKLNYSKDTTDILINDYYMLTAMCENYGNCIQLVNDNCLIELLASLHNECKLELHAIVGMLRDYSNF